MKLEARATLGRSYGLAVSGSLARCAPTAGWQLSTSSFSITLLLRYSRRVSLESRMFIGRLRGLRQALDGIGVLTSSEEQDLRLPLKHVVSLG